MYKWYQQFCTARETTGKYRALPEPPVHGENTLLDFSTNDYLGLARSERLKQGALTALLAEGAGSTGSRLLSGNSDRLMVFERRIAADKGTPSALIFNSGFQANLTVLSSLMDESVNKHKAIVFFDRLNHASLYQGAFLSGANIVRYPHRNMERLAMLLDKHKEHPGPRFIVTETIFGMDGDLAPLNDILQLAKKYNAFLYLDEAHATGVLGKRSYGLSGGLDLQNIPYLVMGTFSKALGCFGAYVACDDVIKQFLVNHCSGFIYTTAPSPPMVGAMEAAWESVPVLDDARKKLNQLAGFLREQLKMNGWDTGLSETHIVPVMMGSEASALAAKKKLFQEGIVVSAVRPPTVPPHTSRLRIALTVKHTEEDVTRLIAALGRN